MAHVSQLYIRGSEMTAVNRHYFVYYTDCVMLYIIWFGWYKIAKPMFYVDYYMVLVRLNGLRNVTLMIWYILYSIVENFWLRDKNGKV